MLRYRITGLGPGYRYVLWIVLSIILLILAGACVQARDESPTPEVPTAPPGIPSPTISTPDLEESGVVNRIAYVAPESNIFTIRPDGTDQERLTFPVQQESASLLPAGAASEDTIYNWPTWSPDATQIAITAFLADGEGPGVLYTVDTAGGLPKKLYENPPDTVGRFVATRSPHYIYWSPDSQSIAFLAPSQFNLTLFLIKADGSSEPRVVAHGAPSYLSWSPDGRYILHHLDERLALVDTTQNSRPLPLPVRSAAFRAPSWAPDSQRIAFADRLNGADALKVADVMADNQVVVTTVPQLGAFIWSPSANDLGYVTITNKTDLGVFTYAGLTVFDADTAELHRITDDELVAFFWSPDGSKLAYVAVDRVNNSLAWYVADSRGNSRRKLTTFIPSAETLFTLFSFFDQYAYTNGLWSPDSKNLVYAGREESANGTGVDSVFVVPVDGSAPPRAIAQGTLAFWSPR